MSNLASSTSYNFDGFCATQANVETSLATVPSGTSSNGGKISSMVFSFASALTTAQKIKLVCALALEFKIDYTKVSTSDGYYCS